MGVIGYIIISAVIVVLIVYVRKRQVLAFKLQDKLDYCIDRIALGYVTTEEYKANIDYLMVIAYKHTALRIALAFKPMTIEQWYPEIIAILNERGYDINELERQYRS